MKKSILLRAVIGFFCGIAIGFLVPLITCLAAGQPVSLYSARLLSMVKSPALALIVQAAASGLYGAVCMGGTVVYDIEHWPLLRAIAVHYLLCMVPFVPIALLLGWFDDAVTCLIMIGAMTVAYFIIWLSIYLSYKRQGRRMNDDLKHWKDAQGGE